jgi:hypothetical protein
MQPLNYERNRMAFPLRRLFVSGRDRSSPPPESRRVVLTRVIGNDFPPRQAAGQNLTNLRFILENEPDLADCSKRWIVNRVADPEVEKAVIAALEEHRQSYSRIGFRLKEFALLHRDRAPAGWRDSNESDVIGDLVPEARRALLRAERPRIAYAIPINAARNQALREARNHADWILPFDGNCFMSQEAWADIRAFLGGRPGLRYLTVAMARLAGHDGVFDRAARAKADGEPQIMFHRDAALAFDESYPYGRRDKAELLWRLGVAGAWDRWRDDPWDPPRPKPSATKGEVGSAGWVVRLPSGRAEQDVGHAAARERGLAREEAILQFLGALDARVRRVSLPAQ